MHHDTSDKRTGMRYVIDVDAHVDVDVDVDVYVAAHAQALDQWKRLSRWPRRRPAHPHRQGA